MGWIDDVLKEIPSAAELEEKERENAKLKQKVFSLELENEKLRREIPRSEDSIRQQPKPFVSVFITEESGSNEIDLNRIRSHFRLTRRETDVLGRVLNGLKNIEISDDLDISEQTVKDHLSDIYAKLGVENRFALASLLFNSPEFKHT